MNYKGILTEEAAEGFKKEGATIAVVTLYNKAADKVIRDIEVELKDEQIFCIAGKTMAGQAAMEKAFNGSVINSKKWYPFGLAYAMLGKSQEKVIEESAKFAGCDPSDLEWALIDTELLTK